MAVDVTVSGLNTEVDVTIDEIVQEKVDSGALIVLFDHDEALHRDYPSQHPISAITNLQDELDLKLEDAPSDDKYYARKDGEWTEIEGGDSGTIFHDELEHRNYPNQHPMSAITGLDTALDNKADKTEIPSLDGYATEEYVGNAILEEVSNRNQ